MHLVVMEKVAVIYVILSRRSLKHVTEIVSKYNPQAIFTIEDIRSVNRHYQSWLRHKNRNKHK